MKFSKVRVMHLCIRGNNFASVFSDLSTGILELFRQWYFLLFISFLTEL
jgi:hypothetical protein